MNLLVLAKLIDKSTNMLPVEEFYHGNDICQSFHCSDNTGADTVFYTKWARSSLSKNCSHVQKGRGLV